MWTAIVSASLPPIDADDLGMLFINNKKIKKKKNILISESALTNEIFISAMNLEEKSWHGNKSHDRTGKAVTLIFSMTTAQRNRLSNTENFKRLTVPNLWLLGWRAAGEFGVDMYTLLYLKWIINKDLLLHRELCCVCGRLDGRGVWGRMDTCICMAESLCCSPETITTLFISYTSIQTKKFKK